jgi:hypothetical protein
MPSTVIRLAIAAAPATAVTATTIGMLATADNKDASNSRIASVAVCNCRAPAIAGSNTTGSLQQHGYCNSRTPATSGSLQQKKL